MFMTFFMMMVMPVFLPVMVLMLMMVVMPMAVLMLMVMLLPMVMLMVMFLLMAVSMLMVVVLPMMVVMLMVVVLMPVQIFHVVIMILVLLIQQHRKITTVNSRLLYPGHLHGKSVRRNAVQRFQQHLFAGSQIEERRHRHIAADTGITFQIKCI